MCQQSTRYFLVLVGYQQLHFFDFGKFFRFVVFHDSHCLLTFDLHDIYVYFLLNVPPLLSIMIVNDEMIKVFFTVSRHLASRDISFELVLSRLLNRDYYQLQRRKQCTHKRDVYK